MIGYIITDKDYIPDDGEILDVYFDSKSGRIKSIPIEFNKKYDYNGENEGFHINKNIWNCFIGFYHDYEYRILKVDTMDDDNICIKNRYIIAYSFIVLEEVAIEEISRDITDNYKAAFQYDNIKLIAIKLNCCLDILYRDKNWFIREEVAKVANNQILDQLIYDPDTSVRKEIVKRKYRLALFVDDESWMVRKEVAHQGYGLNMLINDTNSEIRKEVALQGHGYWKFLLNKRDRNLKLHKIAMKAWLMKHTKIFN